MLRLDSFSRGRHGFCSRGLLPLVHLHQWSSAAWRERGKKRYHSASPPAYTTILSKLLSVHCPFYPSFVSLHCTVSPGLLFARFQTLARISMLRNVPMVTIVPATTGACEKSTSLGACRRRYPDLAVCKPYLVMTHQSWHPYNAYRNIAGIN